MEPLGSALRPARPEDSWNLRLARIRDEAVSSASRFPDAAEALGLDVALVIQDLARFPGDKGHDVDLQIIFTALDELALNEFRSEYRQHCKPGDPEVPSWLVEGEVWNVYVMSPNHMRESHLYSSEPAAHRREELADMAQDVVIEAAHSARPVCPADGGDLIPEVSDGLALWRCPQGRWQCEIGSYRESRSCS